MVADVAQVAVDHAIGREHEGDVAQRGGALPPEQQREPDHDQAQHHQDALLQDAGERGPGPGDPRARPPARQDPAKARVLAALRAERLDDRVAAHRVGQRAAQAAVPCVGTPRRGRDVVERQLHRDRHIEDGADADGEPHQRPMPAEQESRANKHDERRPQRHEHRVVQHVEGPHAAAQLAHRGAGEAVGMPVGREALHAPEGLARHLAHHAQGEAYDALEQAPAQDHQGNAEAEDRGERLERVHHGGVALPRGIGQGIDHLAGKDRQGEFGRRDQHQAGRHGQRQAPLPAPPAGDEPNRPEERIFSSLSSARSHCSMPRPRRGEGPQKVVRAHAAMKRGNVRRREWSVRRKEAGRSMAAAAGPNARSARGPVRSRWERWRWA